MIMLAKRDEINYKKTWWENYSKERKVFEFSIRLQNM